MRPAPARILLALVLLLSLVPIPAAASPLAGAVALTVDPSVTTITLITGDTVKVRTAGDGKQAVEVEPADPRTGLRTTTVDGDLYVVPQQALGYLAAGVLDRRLFNVSGLIRQGYDERTGGLPLIVDYRGAAPERTGLAARSPERRLPSIGAVALTAGREHLRTLWDQVAGQRATTRLAGGVERIWLDAAVRPVLDQSVPMIGAPAAWARGLDGSGVKVAVLDSGYDPDHPDLAGRVDAAQNFTEDPSVVDGNGHGTHVAATLAGSGAASGARYRGVAPGARLLVGKVLSNWGTGTSSSLIAGMEWAVAQGARVVNLSIGSDPSNGTDPVSTALNRLSEQSGTLFVVAAGNDGPAESSVNSPGSADRALTVGNVDKAGGLALTSSRGPRLGDGAIKPELTAPGTEIVAARAKDTFLGRPIDRWHSALSGTSMASPHVAGSAAILAQQHPDWNAETLKAALTSTAAPNPQLNVFQQGGGLVNVDRAGRATARPSTGTLSLGRFDWPHDGSDAPVVRTVDYRNDGAAEVVLDLAADVRSTAGTPAGVTVSPASLTVPAGGSATATVTLDPNTGGTGRFGGYLSATGADGSTVRTAIGFVKDAPTYTVTVEGFARDGRPAGSPSDLDLFSLATAEYYSAAFTAGRAQVKVPAGDYSVQSFLFTLDESGTEEVETTLAVRPELRVDRDLTIRLDARQAVPIDVDVHRDTDRLNGKLAYHRTNGQGSLTSAWRLPTTVRRLSAVPMPAVTRGDFEAFTKLELVAPRARLRLHPSSGGTRLDPFLMYGSAPVHGTFTLPVVDAGTGLEAQGLAGKFALIRPAAGVPVSTQVAAVQAAGAAAVGLANDRPGLLDPSAGSNVRIPVLVLPQADGDLLRQRLASTDQVRVVLSGTDAARSPYLYDLALSEPGRIRDRLRYDIGSDDVATLRTDFRASTAGQPGRDIRHSWRPYETSSIAVARELVLPLRRTEYVTAGDHAWQQAARQKPPYAAELTEVTTSYRPWQRLDRTWFAGPLAPRVAPAVRPRPDLGRPPNRRENYLYLEVPEFGDSDPNHTGLAESGLGDVTAARVYRDGELIHQAKRFTGRVAVPPEASRYRLELDVQRGGDFWLTSTRTRTEWEFRSALPVDPEPHLLPLLQAELDLPLSMLNTAPERSGVPVSIRPFRSDRPVDVGSIGLEVSYDDGASWRPVGLRSDDGAHAGLVPVPGRSEAEHVSLRTTVRDRDGNSVRQEVVRAFGITGR